MLVRVALGLCHPLGRGHLFEGGCPVCRGGQEARGSPGNEAVGCCHHPLGPDQEAPADVLTVHLDGGDEGPGVGCHRLSPDDPAPLGAWWVGTGCHRCQGVWAQLLPVPVLLLAVCPEHPSTTCRSSPGSPSPAPAVGTNPSSALPAGSSTEPPRLRMNSPAMTMLVQSRPQPPPLGLLRAGGA